MEYHDLEQRSPTFLHQPAATVVGWGEEMALRTQPRSHMWANEASHAHPPLSWPRSQQALDQYLYQPGGWGPLT